MPKHSGMFFLKRLIPEWHVGKKNRFILLKQQHCVLKNLQKYGILYRV